MAEYLLGVATLPLLAGAVFALFFAYRRFESMMDTRFGVTWEAKIRDTGKISNYLLKHDIWWERSWGPVFAGGWYREEERYKEPSVPKFNRWIGFGPANGPCVMFFREMRL